MIKTIKLPERRMLIKVCDKKSYKTCLKYFKTDINETNYCDFLGTCHEADSNIGSKFIISIDVDLLKTKYDRLNVIAHEVNHLMIRYARRTNTHGDKESNANLNGYLVAEISKIFKVI